MAVEIRETSKVGTSSPVVARLVVQTSELIQFLSAEKDVRAAVVIHYAGTLKDRLLRCHEIRNDLTQRLLNDQVILPERDTRVVRVPHVPVLQSLAENFLYETKNYIRDVIQLFNIVFNCELADAGDFADLPGRGESKVVKWAAGRFGANAILTAELKKEVIWTRELIGMRNAVEHPGGKSGTLTILNVRRTHEGPLIPPTWQWNDRPESSILRDMATTLENLLTLAEDLLAGVILTSPIMAQIGISEIPEEARDPMCPVRLRAVLTDLNIGESALR